MGSDPIEPRNPVEPVQPVLPVKPCSSRSSMITSTPAVGRTISRSDGRAKLASHLVEQTFEDARRQVEYDEVPQEGPSEIAQNIKQMLEKSAAEDLPPSPLPEENAAKTQADRHAILLRSRQHQTFSESLCYDGVKYDYEESETTEAEETLNEPSNISLWEEGYDEEPIVGNEKVNVCIPKELETDEIPDLSPPGFDFDESHQISQCTIENEETNEDTINRLTEAPREAYRLTPSLTPRSPRHKPENEN